MLGLQDQSRGLTMAKPTKHQEDLFMDDVIRRESRITEEDLATKSGLSLARVRSRVKYDIGLDRARRLADGSIQFYLSEMADRWVKPFKG
jgi:hypothetical protein